MKGKLNPQELDPAIIPGSHDTESTPDVLNIPESSQTEGAIHTPKIPNTDEKRDINENVADGCIADRKIKINRKSVEFKPLSHETASVIKLAPHEDLDDDVKNYWEYLKGRRPCFIEYHELVHQIFDCNPIAIDTGANPKFTKKGVGGDMEKFIAKNKVPFTCSNAYSLLKYVTEKYIYSVVGAYNNNGIDDWTNLPSMQGMDNRSYLEIIHEKLQSFSAGLNAMHQLPPNPLSNNGTFNDFRPLMQLELIWSYWMEEGLLEQTMLAISRRFQNLRSKLYDPLANLTIDPLRPINNLLWGWIQDTQHRLTITRRSFEYENEYGFRLISHNISNLLPADRRIRFIGAFNNLLHKCILYYKEFDDLVKRANAFPVLVALKEVHLILTEGSHNQFGDLPATARVEMFMELEILANNVMREFLGGRPMVAYPESWMDRIDSMKTIQRWNLPSITYFYELAENGEILLSSIRNHPWMNVNNAALAGQWAVNFRDQIQIYVNSYWIVTDVDLTSQTLNDERLRSTIPAILIKRKKDRELNVRF